VYPQRGQSDDNKAIPFWQVVEFMNEPSYHEQMTRKEAERELMKQGSSRCYLTRYSDKNKMFKLSVMHSRRKNKFEHFDISRTKYTLKDSDMEFDTLAKMLEHYRSHRISKTLRNIGISVECNRSSKVK
jgi:uncharacterized protein YkuJ